MTFVRMAQSGDVCVLLEPDDDDGAALRERQAALQKFSAGASWSLCT